MNPYLTSDSLETQLQKGKVLPCYFLAGLEYFLLQEARDLIFKTACQTGIINRQIIEVNAHLDWEQLNHQYKHADLFQRGLLIDLRFNKPPVEATAKLLKEFITHAMNNSHAFNQLTIMISCDQWSKNLQKTNWVQELSQVSTIVILEPPSLFNLPHWLDKRIQRTGLRLTQEALIQLSQFVEGNVVAAMQIIEKLKLLYGGTQTTLSLESIKIVLHDQAKFELFTLVDAILQGHKERCMRVLKFLEMTGTPPALILSYLLKPLRSLSALRYGVEHKQSLPLLFKQNNIWIKQQGLFQRALQQCDYYDLTQLFNLASQIDRIIKGAHIGNIWESLQIFSLRLSYYFLKN